MPIEDRWIFSRLNSCAEQVNRAIEQYRYHEAAQVLWHFFWHEFCDWYLELKKLRFRENSGLDAGLAQHAGGVRDRAAAAASRPCRSSPKSCGSAWPARPRRPRPASIALAAYPQYRQDATDFAAEREIGILQEIVTMARTLRTESKLDPKQQLAGALYSRSAALEVAQRHAEAIQKLANVKLEFKAEAAPKAAGHALHRRVRPGAATCPSRRKRRSASAWRRSASSSTRTSPTPSAS